MVIAPLLAPAGVGVEAGQTAIPQPEPEYLTNATGQTLGSLADATSPENEPDLILVVATNGKEGYVKKVELDATNGHTAWSTLTDNEMAKWTLEREKLGIVNIPVYAADGKTIIGDFPVSPGGIGNAPKSAELLTKDE